MDLDYLLEAAAGAASGFERSYVPFKKMEFEDTLARNRKKQGLADELEQKRRLMPEEEASKLRVAQGESDIAERRSLALIDPQMKADIEKERVKAGLRPNMKPVYGLDGNIQGYEKDSGKGKTMTAPSIMALNEGKKAYLMLPDTEKAVVDNKKLFGPISGRVGENNPYDTQSQTVDAQMRAASQSFGRFMEGGVLRKEDEEKYRHMFPRLSDRHEVAKNKLEIVKKILADKYESDRVALGDSGYDISGFDKLEIPKSVFGGGSSGGSKSQDQEAMEWAKANPKDPRASAIMKKAQAALGGR